MPRLSSSQQIAAIMGAAVRAAEDDYLAAVAGEIDGTPVDGRWVRFRDVLARAYVLAQLTGMASAIAKARIGQRSSSRPVGEVVMATDVDVSRFVRETVSATFESGPFLEAIRQFDGRIPRLRSQVQRAVREAVALADAAMRAERGSVVARLQARSQAVARVMSGSFFVSSADRKTVVNLRALVAEALRGGVDRDEAGKIIGLGVSGFIDEAQLAGAVNLTRARLETVYRNNINSAANEGQVLVLSSPETRLIIPLLILREVKDRRTRGNPSGLYPDRGFHFQMDGFVGTVEDFDRWGIVPPNGHNCRGGVRGMSRSESESRGFVDEKGRLVPAAIAAHNGERLRILASGLYPDPGFQSGGRIAA